MFGLPESMIGMMSNLLAISIRQLEDWNVRTELVNLLSSFTTNFSISFLLYTISRLEL